MGSRMNVKQLEVFVAIAETGSFSKGAEAACITQSTVSQHIASLEESCGVRLFDRTGRGAVLTEAGGVLLVYARQVVKALKETGQAMLRYRRADGAELSVGGSTIPGTYLLPKAIAALRESAPGITVKADIGVSREILSKLQGGYIEIGIIGTVADNREFTCEALGEDTILLVVRRGHPWSGRTGIYPEELLAEPMALRGKGSGSNDAAALELQKHGINMADLQVAATLSTSEAVRQSVLAGCGAAFISELAVRQELRQGVLVSVPLNGISIKRSFSLVSRKGRTLSPAGEAFCRIVRQMNL